MLDGCVDLSNLIDPIIDLKDLGGELSPTQLADLFFHTINNYNEAETFVKYLNRIDLGWIQDAIANLMGDETYD